jgi:hypothetical protein
MKRNIIKIFSFLLFIFQSANLFADAQTNKEPKTDLAINFSSIASDSVKIETGDSLHIPQSEFYYADNPRYTINGELPLRTTKIKPIPTLILGGIYTGVFIAQHVGQMNTIWKDQTSFKFQEDGIYALYVDKAGHFYGSCLSSYVMHESFLLAGFNPEASIWLGAGLGLGYSTYVEILDGFGKSWGFSPSDFYCDVLGASYSVAQYYFPVLQNFTPKFSYYPAKWYGERQRVPSQIFIDDYSSQNIWMSINVHNLLPNTLKNYWPSWLQLSLGYTARNLCDPMAPEAKKYHYDYKTSEVCGDPKFMLALDYDFTKILPDGSPFWNWLRQSLNYFKFPSPTIEFSKSRTRFFLMYPFPIKIGGLNM